MDIRSIFDRKASQLFWRPLPGAHVIGGIPQQPCEPNESYFAIRIAEMHLESCRKLWKQVYPLVHAYIDTGGAPCHAIAGPGQLTSLGDSNLNLVTDIDQHLIGPTPYCGGDVHLLAGLYSIPGRDTAKLLVETMAALAGIAVHMPVKVMPLAALVKSSIEGLVGIDQATLHLGIQCSFGSSTCPLSSGYWLGIAAPENGIDVRQLWLKGGRLSKGADPGSAQPYADHDFMVIAIERLQQRADWRVIPVVTDWAGRFGKIAGDPDYSVAEKRKRLAALWPGFQQALADSRDLIDNDRRSISKAVSADLLLRLDSQGAANPFLPQSCGSSPSP